MNYKTGETIELGDNVLIENGNTPATVNRIIDTDEVKKSIGVEEFGVILKSEPFGLVFWGNSDDSDPIVFVSRA